MAQVAVWAGNLQGHHGNQGRKLLLSGKAPEGGPDGTVRDVRYSPGTGRRLVNSSGEIVKGRKVTDGNDQKWEVSSGGAIRVYGSDETAEIVAPEATTSY